MDSNNGSGNKQIWVVLAVLIVIAIIVGGGALVAKGGDDESTEPSTSQSGNTSTKIDNSATYKDGTYTADSNFSTPGGRDNIALTLTIKDGVIADTSAKTMPPDNESVQFDQDFLDAYKKFVVGKSLSQVQVSRVAGASLTTQGFNNALEQIANQAKV
jgi:uncharacterized protein with FMN-binding domain